MYIGGWTTSHRMHEPVKGDYIFGCAGSPDALSYYLLCSPLWQNSAAAVRCEAPIFLAERLCLDKISICNLHLLALCFSIYHFCRSKHKDYPQLLVDSDATQRIAVEASRALARHVKVSKH